jgi:hypothetical protein
MKITLNKALTLGFSALWILIIFIDFWYYHIGYGLALEHFQYYDTILLLTVLGGAVFWSLKNLREKQWFRFIANGAGVLLLFLLICGIILWTHYPKVSGEMLDIGSGLIYLGKILYFIGCTYFIFGTCYVLGDFVLPNIFSISFSTREGDLVKMALGVTLITLVLMLLGFLGLLTPLIIFPLILIIVGGRWKSSLSFVKRSLLGQLDKSNGLNWMGFGSFYILLIFLSLNFLTNVRPFPFGFDALSIYLNLPKLIGDSQGLIEGYSPYYWSLFVALGHILFDQIEVVIALSVSGGILSLYVLNEICRKWLDQNYSLLVLILFYTLPLVNYQSFRDIKTDLGLLFILLTIILLLIKWLSLTDKAAFLNKKTAKIVKKNKHKSKAKHEAPILKETPIALMEQGKGLLGNYWTEATQMIILLGLFSGMGLGIKLTGLITIFSILSVISYVKGGEIGFLANVVLTFFVIIMAELDLTLRPYHFEVDRLKWASLVIGVGLLGYLGIKNRKAFLDLLRVATVYIAILTVVYMPWPIKNYQETGEISVKTFIEGRDANVPDGFK